MKSKFDQEKIQNGIRDALAVALAIRAEDILPETRIITDLDAESLDLLDLRFRLEEVFKIRIEQEHLARAFGTELTPAEFRERFTLAALSNYVRERLED